MKYFVIILVLVGFAVPAVFPNMVYGLPIPILCDYDNPRINLVPIKDEFSPEEPITIKVDSVPEDTLEVIVKNPKNMETFSDVIKTDSSGDATIDIPMPQNPLKGTWKIFAISHSNESQEVAFVGVGQSPKQHLTINPYQITHAAGKNSSASFLVVGDPEQSSSVRVFDSNGNDVYHNEVVILPSEGHCRYSLDLTGFDSDVYTIALSSDSESASADFNVGTVYGGGSPTVTIELSSPLKQFNSAIPFDKIQCKENLVLLQKYDGMPACVTEQTKTKLIEREWTSTNGIHNTAGSSNGHWKLKSETFVAIPSHELNPIDAVNVDGRYSATAILTKPHGMSDQHPSLGYVMYVQVLDPNGDTIAGSWHHGTIQTNQTISAGTYWSPKDVGKHTLEVFVWQSFTGTPHADVSRHTVEVTE